MEVKSGYRETEIGTIPIDWDVKLLGEVGEALIGLTYRPSDVRQHGTLVLRSSNIQADALAFNDNVFVDTKIPDRIMVMPEDVLICVRNGSRDLIGKSALLDERTRGMTFGAFMAVYRSPIGRLSSYLFQSSILKRQIEAHLGATINQITNKSLNSFKVPLPSSEVERSAIITTLSDVDALLAKLDQLIAKKRDLRQAAMQQLLTGQTRLPGFRGDWERVKLSQLGFAYGGLSGKSKADFDSGNCPYVTFMNVMSNVVIDPAQLGYVRVSSSESQNHVIRGDLLFNGSSETPEEVAMCAYVDCDIPDLYLNSFCFGFRFTDRSKINGSFLASFFRSSQGREIVKSLAQGSTRYNISKPALTSAVLTLPARDEQDAISEVLADIDSEIAFLQDRVTKTKAIKQGMMQQLLTGKVRLV